MDVGLNGLNGDLKLYEYQVTPATANNPELKTDPREGAQVNRDSGLFVTKLPASSLTVFSTHNLGHGQFLIWLISNYMSLSLIPEFG